MGWTFEEVPVQEPEAPTQGPTIFQRMFHHYRRVPGWVLVPQIFLAAAWGRAGFAHLISPQWWRGEEVLDFLATETEHRVDLYEPFLTAVVHPLPVITALIVLVAELVVAVMVALNYRLSTALAVGAFLNIQFILAGAVNPSIFYLVVTLGIAIWRLETIASPATIRRLARFSPALVIAAVALLAPSIRSFSPEAAIEDPALVLIFLAAIVTVTLWWVDHRIMLAEDALTELTGDEAGHAAAADRTRFTLWPVVSTVVTVAVLLAGIFLLGGGDRADEIGGTVELARQGQEVTGDEADAGFLGSFQTPYPYGRIVTLSYDDPETGSRREWQIQVVEFVADRTDEFALTLEGPDDALATARVRVSYREGDGRGPLSDLRYGSVGPSGAVFAASVDRCGSPTGRLAVDAELEPSQTVEGMLCWRVPADEVSSLVLAVEAEPADGVAYLALR